MEKKVSEQEILIWLSMFDFITSKKFQMLLDYYKTAENIYNAFVKQDIVLREIFNNSQLEEVFKTANEIFILVMPVP